MARQPESWRRPSRADLATSETLMHESLEAGEAKETKRAFRFAAEKLSRASARTHTHTQKTHRMDLPDVRQSRFYTTAPTLELSDPQPGWIYKHNFNFFSNKILFRKKKSLEIKLYHLLGFTNQHVCVCGEGGGNWGFIVSVHRERSV